MTSFFVGGPAYNLQLDARHAGCMVELAMFVGAGHQIADVYYPHSSILPQGRAKWLGRAIDSGADIGITMDADTWIATDELMTGGARLARLALGARRGLEDPWALIGVLVPQRDGRVNAWRAEGERLRESEATTIVNAGIAPRAWTSVHAVAQACAIYNLAWWRQWQGRERHMFAMMPAKSTLHGPTDVEVDDDRIIKAPERYAYIGEDVWHCAWIRSVGGVMHAADIGAVHGGRS